MIVSQLGQKPKLGGRYAYTDRPLISTFASCQFFVYPCFAFSCLFLLVLFIFLKTQNIKNIFFVSLCFTYLNSSCSFIFVFHFELWFYFVFLIFELPFKKPKTFSLLFVSSWLCFKFENIKNICCSSWFCIVLFRFNSRL